MANHADILDGDIHWTKDSPNDSDKLGTILIIHDSTLDRITNCKGKVSSWRWGSIRAKCRTDHGKQPLLRLKDLIAYGKASGKQVAIGLKNGKISNAQAKDLWNTIKSSNVQLEAPASRLAALNKVKKLDKADPKHKIKYALVATGSGGWPSVSKVKSVGSYFHAGLSISSSRMKTYKDAGIKVFLTASAEERAERRYKQLKDKGVSVTLAGLLREILARDARDASRAVAPLRPAEDAVRIDTTGLPIEVVVERVLALLPERRI